MPINGENDVDANNGNQGEKRKIEEPLESFFSFFVMQVLICRNMDPSYDLHNKK